MPPPGPTCEQIEIDACAPAPAGSFRYLVSNLDVPGPVEGVQVGLDIDCRTSRGRDPETCNVDDTTSPDGEEGVDNAVGTIIGAIDAAAGEEKLIAIAESTSAAFADGTFVLPIAVSGVDDLVDDPCVGVVIDTATAEGAFIEDGVLHAFFTELPLSLPTTAAPLEATLERVAVRGAVSEAGIANGVIAGELATADAIAAAMAVNPDALGIEYLPPLVESLADLAPDARGACQRISIGIAFTAVPAP
jgi:hypothetical protein